MKKLSFIIVLLALVIGGFFAWWINGLQAVDPSNTQQTIFTVKKGDTIREIANNLKTEGFIKDPVLFFLYLKQNGLDQKVQAGEFHLSPSMAAGDIAKALQKGSFDTYITIPEGKRADEIADILQAHLPQYQENWRPMLRFEEGYLFPDTYAFAKDVDITQIIAAMKANFEKKYITIPNTSTTPLTKEQIVILASIIEREAKLPEDRPLVASVMLNRIKNNMPLQIDATVQYALGYNSHEQTWWKKNLTLQDLKVNSPYNTYENTGLPPKPISNPGFEALKAVLEAPQTDYLYYISDKTGRNHYAKTFEEHASLIKQYGLDN